MKLTIEVQPNDEVKVEREFASRSITIGRSRECDLILATPQVSSRHARIHASEGRCYVSDLGSTNGTRLNGRLLKSQTARIEEGDEVRFGDSGPRIRIRRLQWTADRAQVRSPQEPALVPVAAAEKRPAAAAVATPTKAEVAASPRPVQPVGPLDVPKTASPAVPFDEHRRYPLRTCLFHTVAASLTATSAVLFWLAYYLSTQSLPKRGYTPLGLGLAAIATVLLLGITGYAWRKRAGQEYLPGRLQTWLRVHLWCSVAAFWFLLLHAGFHLDGGSGTWAMILLLLTLATGLAGWAIFVRCPTMVYHRVGNLASGDVERRLRELEDELDDTTAGRSPELLSLVERIVSGRSFEPFAGPDEEQHLAEHVTGLGLERTGLLRKLRTQRRLRRALRGWLWLHIPLALLFVAVSLYHVYDATEVRWIVDDPGPADFASSESCEVCHQQQYDEWIASMHAIAQASPVTDLQNRLVLLKEQRDLASGARDEPLVGDLCVRCHAPTGSLGSPREREDPLIEITDRAPSSQFGVSCVACHQIDSLTEHPPDVDEITYSNAGNLTWTEGRLMLGSFGDDGELPSVGNAAHRGEFREFFGDSRFCASCHTVVVDDPERTDEVTGGNVHVRLQNTYREWLEGNEGVLNWSELGVQCLDCHGRDLNDIDVLVQRFEDLDVPLEERRDRIRQVIRPLQLRDAVEYAAEPTDAFDLPLIPRRRYLHTFVGVDYHLEDSLPYPVGHPRFDENHDLQVENFERVEQLLRMAAAIRVTGVQGDTVSVDVMNLATGHHLPAGFSFAREMWVEIAISQRASGDDWRVLVGGRRGRPLARTEPLPDEPGLRNFQAVLYGRRDENSPFEETVLQNEAVEVLTGERARELGFTDRVRFLLPGEIRRLDIPAGGSIPSTTRRVRARLRFRNYPPEFMERLAQRFDELGDTRRAARARALINGLRIVDMAEHIAPTNFQPMSGR